MKITIHSREEVENISKEPFPANTAIISITDANWTFAKLKNKPAHLLQLSFDDVDNDIFENELFNALNTDLHKLIKNVDNISYKVFENELFTTVNNNAEEIQKKYHMFTDAQAFEIADFYHKICNTAQFLICQCEHGQSRSAAIAAAIMEYINKKGIDIFSDDKYFPNKVVYRKTLFALKNYKSTFGKELLNSN